MSRYSDLPFVQAGGHGGTRTMTQCVVIHATDNTAPASGEANYAKSRSDGVSAHFYSDEGAVIQALDTALVAYGCFPTGNSRSVQFELVGRSNQLTDATMRRIAPIVARACAEFGIPIRHVGSVELRAGQRGICGHGDVTRAWGEGDHVDPGDSFPWDRFISYVAAAAGGGTDVELTDKLAGTPDHPNRTVAEALTDVWQRCMWDVLAIKATVEAIKADLAKRPTPAVDTAALAEALKPVLAGLVAETVGDELAARLAE